MKPEDTPHEAISPMKNVRSLEELARDSFTKWNNGSFDTKLDPASEQHLTSGQVFSFMRHNYLIGYEHGFEEARLRALANWPSADDAERFIEGQFADSQWSGDKQNARQLVLRLNKIMNWSGFMREQNEAAEAALREEYVRGLNTVKNAYVKHMGTALVGNKLIGSFHDAIKAEIAAAEREGM